MSTQKDLILKLISAMGELDEPGIRECVRALASEGMAPQDIQRNIHIGLKLVDGYYTSGEYFLADLLYAGRVYESVMKMRELQVLCPDVLTLGCKNPEASGELKGLIFSIREAVRDAKILVGGDTKLAQEFKEPEEDSHGKGAMGSLAGCRGRGGEKKE